MKSFYDNDFLIELNEKRCAEYASLAQQMTSRFSMLFVFYSVMIAASVPVVKLLLKSEKPDWILAGLYLCFTIYIFLSICNALLLIIPNDTLIIAQPRNYSHHLKEILSKNIPVHEFPLSGEINDSLKLVYLCSMERLTILHHNHLEKKEQELSLSIKYAITALVFFLLDYCYFLIHY